MIAFFKPRNKRRSLLKKRPPKTRLGKRFKDPFGDILPIKRALISLLGIISYRRFNIVNRMNVVGMEHLKDLPKTNVLFVSNHQTYYADVIGLYHVFCSAKWGLKNIDWPVYLLSPRVKSYYVAAEETMKDSGLLPNILSYTGAVTVKRSWRHKGQAVQRGADRAAPDKIKTAMEYGWVINFPQGTTTKNAPVRKGAAKLIQALNPVVVPVTIDGFREAFGKKGLSFNKRGVQLSVEFGTPIQFGESATTEEIMSFLERHLIIKE